MLTFQVARLDSQLASIVSTMRIVNALVLFVALPTTAAIFETKYPPGMDALVDASISPCEDFYQYACGGWLKSHDIPPDRSVIDPSFETVSDSNTKVLIDIFKKGKPLVGEFFQSCMNMEALNKAGTKPLEAVRAQIAAVKTKGELIKLAGQISVFGPKFFFSSISVDADPQDATRSILYLEQETRNTVKDDRFEAEFIKYITQLNVLNGVDKKMANEKAMAVSSLYKSVGKSRISSETSDRKTFEQAVKKYPNIFGLSVVEGLGLLKTTLVKPTDTVVLVTKPVYFKRIESLIKETDLEMLKSLVEYQYLDFAAKYMGQAFLDARFDFYDRYLLGQQSQMKREDKCVSYVQGAFPNLVGKYFVEAKFDTSSEKLAQTMINLVEEEMKTRIKNLTWLDDATRQEALKKLSKVTHQIGNSGTVEDFTAQLDPTDFFKNQQAVAEYKTKRTLAKINTPVDPMEWSESGAEVNAWYTPTRNQMIFPAGILQPPIFSTDFHPVQNFGSIGFMMGHELTHGFDQMGRDYDGQGNVHNWWTDETEDEFKKRASDLAYQYSRFKVTSAFDSSVSLGQVDGWRTLGENIADNGGFGLAFDAFHRYLEQTPVPTPANTSNVFSLRDLERSFFLAFAQNYCTKETDGLIIQYLAEDPHPPGVVRVNGVVQNSDHFGDLFECANGTPMNPKKKFKVW